MNKLIWLSLLLMLVLLWPLSGVRFGPAQVSESTALLTDDLPALDSFSGPAIATAILQRQVEILFLACLRTNEARRLAEGIRTAAIPHPQTQTGERRFSSDQAQGIQLAGGESLFTLDGRLRRLRAELLQDLLAVHYQNRSWNDFVNAYLELLAVEPDKVGMAFWTRSALACSHLCGRTDEVLDAVQRIARFSKNPKTVVRLQAVLADWSAGRIQGLPTDDGLAPQRG